MRTLATKQPTHDSAKQNKGGSRVRSACSSASRSRSISPLSTGMPLLQRKCACGGGCPRCKENLGIQTKLKIGEPGDKYEQEADRVADEVMRMPEPSIQRQVEPEEEEEEEETLQAKPISSQITPLIQRRVEPQEDEEEEEDMVQRKANISSISSVSQGKSEVPPLGNQASGDLESRLNPSQAGGSPLSEDVREFMEPRFGADFSGVRVHTGGEAVQMNRELGAQAFTHGSDVYFGEGKQPGNNELTAHELAHVVQQTGVGNNSIVQNKVYSCSCPECVGTLGQLKRQSTRSLNTVNRTLIQTSIQGLTRTNLGIQCKPAEVTSYKFMGLNVRGGINAEMQSRLTDVTNHLRSRYEKIHKVPPTNDKELREWLGVSNIRGWRERSSNTSHHCSGSAVDVNYKTQPYIVTRTRTQGKTLLGGEKEGKHLTPQRKATVEVFDRAVNFVHGSKTADVSSRRPTTDTTKKEKTTSVYRRFRGVSDDLSTYLGLVFHTNPTVVKRPPIANIEGATNADLLDAIPTTEREEESVAIENIRKYLLSHTYETNTLEEILEEAKGDFDQPILSDYEHEKMSVAIEKIRKYLLSHTYEKNTLEEILEEILDKEKADVDEILHDYERKEKSVSIEKIRQYFVSRRATLRGKSLYLLSVREEILEQAEEYFYRILRDYEHVRIPMVKGDPEARPGITRNPARGFLDMTEEFVVAMTDQGRLRWGIADLGYAQSGDTHHFDLGKRNDGGVTRDCSK